MKRMLSGFAVLLALAAVVAAAPKETGMVVDSGTFDVLVDGKRVGTENFKIQQNAGGSVTTSTIKVLAGGTKAEQSSTLELTPTGDLVRYSWKELSPGKAQTTVEVTAGTLLQRISLPENKKPVDVPYMTPPSTAILDDNFFAHRELLVWRFLGSSSCGMREGKRVCNPLKLGFLVPARHTKDIATLEMVGTEKLTWKGIDRELVHLKLTSDDVAWDIWVDPADSYKVLRIAIPASKTEIVRA